MPTAITHSITDTALGDYVDEVSKDGDIDVSERKGTNGVFAKVKAINPKTEFSIKGGGDLAIGLGAQTLTITGLTGGTKMINKFRLTEKNSDFNDSEASGKHYPVATVLA